MLLGRVRRYSGCPWRLYRTSLGTSEPSSNLLGAAIAIVCEGTVGWSHPRAAAGAYVVSMFMASMDTHIVNVALPTLSREFRAPISSVEWTVISYVLSLALWIPASGWIGDRLGTKRTFLVALVLFTVSSALCGQARSLAELVAAAPSRGQVAGCCCRWPWP